jgi:hypothetical protein
VPEKLTVLEAYREGKLSLPADYTLEHGADALLLRREDASVVAVFSVRGRHLRMWREPPGTTTMKRAGVPPETLLVDAAPIIFISLSPGVLLFTYSRLYRSPTPLH